VIDFRLIIDPPLPGAQNMAIDEVLLHDAVENGIASLRFYGWSEPTLSLGYFQRYGDRDSHTASRNCAVIRRQTGGGAILHDRELTYSIALPPAHELAHQSERHYAIVHDAFMKVLERYLPAAVRTPRLSRYNDKTTSHASHEPFLCFQRRSRGDVILESPTGTNAREPVADKSSPRIKILGSAQRRYRGALLQHGSLLLEKSPHAPELAGWRDITGIDVALTDLIPRLTVRLTDALGAPNPLSQVSSSELEAKAEPIANSKYGSAAWTKRR
jgi:lipoate-protein ligase A